MTGEDSDLWLRMLKAGMRVVYNPVVLAYYRRRDGSLTWDTAPLPANTLKVLDGLGQKLDLDAEERAALERQRARVSGQLWRAEAKRAFLAGDSRTAIQQLVAASEHERSFKILAAIFSLRLAPGLLRRAYSLREWLHRALNRKLIPSGISRES